MKARLTLFSLLITLQFAFAKDYKGGEVQSKQAFHYGRFETRFYASDVSGVLSTMFLFENDGWKDTDIWQEIDVEVFGKDPGNVWQTNIIYQTQANGDNHHSEGTHTFANGGKAADWHTYTVDWTPDYVEWFVDGVSIRKETNKTVLDIIGVKPMLVMFNCWASESVPWVGPFEINELPTYQYIDYIKVYDWVSGTTFETSTSYEDNFDSDLNKWNKSNHTFVGNLVDFVPNNVGIKDGYLVLALSTTNNGSVISNAVVPNDNIVGSEELSLGENGSVYPNPTTEVLNLPRALNWSIISSTGIELMNGKSETINVSELNKGFYILKMEEDNRIKTEAFYKR